MYAVARVPATDRPHGNHRDSDLYIVAWPQPKTKAELVAGPYPTYAQARHAFLNDPPPVRRI